jgi:hypothetical protein
MKHQCRVGCPYEGNEIAFVAASIWSMAALLAFLRYNHGCTSLSHNITEFGNAI